MLKTTTAKTNPESKRATGQRRRYTKTKFGCRTCKIRKVRCDETWPTCNNCKRTGRQCDGVAQSAVKESNSVTFIKPLTLSHFQPSRFSGLNLGERQYMDVFRHRLVLSIVGDIGRPSWNHLLLQAAQEEPTLRNAVIAFTVLCKAHDEAKKEMAVWDPQAADVSTEVRLAIRHYGRCIQNMKHTAGNEDGRSMNVVLLCTMVCICFELLMNSPEMALCHLEHSLRILSSNNGAVDKDLALAFTRLDLQAAVFLGLRPPLLAPKGIEPSINTRKQTFEEADSDLTYLMSSVFSFLRTKADNYRYRNPGSIPLDLLIEAKCLEDQLHQFRDLYLGLGTAASDVTSMTSIGEAHLRIKCFTAIILVATSLYAEEAIYDQFTCEFLAIVDCASELLSKSPLTPEAEGSSPHQHTEFTLDMGVIHPLYITASKCRSSLIRRRAIDLLNIAPSLEGAWDAKSYAKVAERLMQLEEGCLEEQQPTDPGAVPEWCRIHSAEIYPHNDRRFADVLFRYRPNGMDGEWSDFSETISW